MGYFQRLYQRFLPIKSSKAIAAQCDAEISIINTKLLALKKNRGEVLKTMSMDKLIYLETPEKLHSIANDLFNRSKKSPDLKHEATQAMELWDAAMGQGHLKSKYSMAAALRKGEGCIKADPVTAAKYFKQLADKKITYGQFYYAEMCQAGEGNLPVDEVTALRYFHEAADGGFPKAFFKIGTMYENGRGGVVKDMPTALSWYKKALAIGDPDALSKVGHMQTVTEEDYGLLYGTPRLVPRDVKTGFALIIKAALTGAGHPMACYHAGVFSLTGDPMLPTLQNDAKAFRWFKKAASLNVTLALVNLARMYQEGRGVKRNPKEAKRLFALAAPHDAMAAESLKAMS